MKYEQLWSLYFVQVAAEEGEKICSNLEKDAKRPSAEGLLRYRVIEEVVTVEVGCNSQKIMKAVPLRKWVELLWDEEEAYDQEVINFCASGV